MSAIQLKVLGRAVVQRDGALLTGRAVQSHHLGLLAFLARAPGRTASRDRLIGLLWPDSDGGRARHRLSVALHAVRRGLGKEAILTSGDAVTLNPDVVRTDVGDFLDALDTGRLGDAVDLYEGPFLDGFYLKDGLDFERWVESERDRLSGLHRSALERLAEEAEAAADVRMAAEWRRRIAAEAPYESAAAVAVMEALVAYGDLAGALAHARSYVTRVEADLGIPAHPRVSKLAEELAQRAEMRHAVRTSEGRAAGGPAGAGAGREASEEQVTGSKLRTEEAGPASRALPSAAPVLLPTRAASDHGALVSWVAGGVMAVAVAWAVAGSPSGADPGGAAEGVATAVVLPFLDENAAAATETMGRRLAAEVGATLAIVPNLEVIDAPDESPEAGAFTDARRLGRRLGVQSVVTGATWLTGRRAVVTARILEVATGDVRGEVTVEKELRDTEELVEALSMAVADSFRTRLARYIPHHYTDSESANEAFLSAVYEHQRLDPERMWVALQQYRRAWEEDPDFALAHAIAGTAYMGFSQILGLSPEVGWERGREHVMRAIEIDPSLPEAYSVLGRLQFWWDRDFEAAEATLRRAIMLYPTHPDARTWYGFYQLYYLNDFDGAIGSIRRSLEVDPLNTGRSADVEVVLYQARRFDEVLAQHAHTQSLDPDVAASLLSYRTANALREMERYDEAIAEYTTLQERMGGSTPAGLLVTYARMGRTEEARRLLAEREASERSQTGASGAGTARVYAALGEMDRAFELLMRAVEPNPASFIHLKTSPNFDDFRSDPRFAHVVRLTRVPVD